MLIRKIAVLLFLALVVSACQRLTLDVSETEKPSDSPEYTVKYDRNSSPSSSK